MTKNYKKKDPHKKRESQKYKHPVPSREFILQYVKEQDEPQTKEQLLTAFNIQKDKEVMGFDFRLKAMFRDGQLHRDRKGNFAAVSKLNLIPGRVIGHRDGYGFVIPDEPYHKQGDIFILEADMRRLFSNDRVLVRVTKVKSSGRREGQVVEVLQRNTSMLAGKFTINDGISFVSPDSKTIPQDILITKQDRSKAKEGDYVLVKIVSQPTKRRLATGTVTKVLGDHLSEGLEVDLSVYNYQLPVEWPQDVLDASDAYNGTVADNDKQGREDLRHLPFITIDGADARDFDDAVFCESRKGGGWTLYVAIADVAHYVQPGEALDQEASNRGNSVYFPGRVIPMLPEILSNELCSLKPDVDRLTMVVKMEFSAKGRLSSSEMMQAIICSQQRFTYHKVAEILEKDLDHARKTELKNLKALFEQLSALREQRGALDFETVETQIVFNDKGKIDRIVPTQRNLAHRMIEECMLIANVAVANYLLKHKINSLFRNHESPESSRLGQLRDFLKIYGLKLDGGEKVQAKDYARLISSIKGREDYSLLQTVILRSLQQAMYSSENQGHFGLSYEAYAHFTSPIRRYPDLMVHRAIKHILAKKKAKKFYCDLEAVNHLAEHCCMTERRADKATREATDRLKCDYMKDKVGKTFSGVIIDVTSFGVFVELSDIYVQGLVHITALKKDYYQFDEAHHCLRGNHSGKCYALRDTLKILVARVDIESRRIDFELA